MINDWSNEYEFLRNDYPSKITLGSETYPDAEHAFQASKTDDPEERKEIAEAPTAKEAKALGRQVKLSPTWGVARLGIMEFIYREKFKDPDLAAKLLATGSEEIVMSDPRDNYWGIGDGTGQNNQGKLLMKIRGEFVIKTKKSDDQELFEKAKQQHNFVVAQPDPNEINRQLIALQEEAERMFELSLNIDDLNRKYNMFLGSHGKLIEFIYQRISLLKSKDIRNDYSQKAEVVKQVIESAYAARKRTLRFPEDIDRGIKSLCKMVIKDHPDQVALYKAGKSGMLGFFVAKVMTTTGGLNPQVISSTISELLGKIDDDAEKSVEPELKSREPELSVVSEPMQTPPDVSTIVSKVTDGLDW